MLESTDEEESKLEEESGTEEDSGVDEEERLDVSDEEEEEEERGFVEEGRDEELPELQEASTARVSSEQRSPIGFFIVCLLLFQARWLAFFRYYQKKRKSKKSGFPRRKKKEGNQMRAKIDRQEKLSEDLFYKENPDSKKQENGNNVESVTNNGFGYFPTREKNGYLSKRETG